MTPPDPTPNGGGEAWDERVAWLKGLHIVAGGGVRPASLSYVTAGEYRADAERLIDRLRTALAAAERAGAERALRWAWRLRVDCFDDEEHAVSGGLSALYPTGGTDGR